MPAIEARLAAGERSDGTNGGEGYLDLVWFDERLGKWGKHRW